MGGGDLTIYTQVHVGSLGKQILLYGGIEFISRSKIIFILIVQHDDLTKNMLGYVILDYIHVQ